MCILTAFGVQPVHKLNMLCENSASVLPPSPPLPPYDFTVHRSGCAGGGHLRIQDPGGGAVRARGLLVPVCGLELGRHHQEQPRLRSHRLLVSALCVTERGSKAAGDAGKNEMPLSF